MAQEQVQIQYDQAEQVASRFGKLAESSQQLLQMLSQITQSLEDGWEGVAADKYQQEWNSLVKPGLTRMIAMFSSFQSTTTEIKTVFQKHEEEASAIFKAWKV